MEYREAVLRAAGPYLKGKKLTRREWLVLLGIDCFPLRDAEAWIEAVAAYLVGEFSRDPEEAWVQATAWLAEDYMKPSWNYCPKCDFLTPMLPSSAGMPSPNCGLHGCKGNA